MRSPLAQLKTKLLNTVNTHYRPAVPAAAHHGANELIGVVDEIFMAMGNCEKCFGRGYLIAERAGKLCDCERAQRLAEFIARYGVELTPDKVVNWGVTPPHATGGQQ